MKILSNTIHDRSVLRLPHLEVSVLALLQLAFVYLPAMNGWFGTVALAPGQWLTPFAVGLGVFLLIELEKAALLKFRRAP